MAITAIAIGRLTKTPELRTTTNGVSCTTITVACDRRYAAADGQRVADFIDVVAWRSSAEFVCKHFKKGDPIAVQGDLNIRTYTDKSGVRRNVAEIIAEHADFVPAPPKDKSAAENASYPEEPPVGTMADMP